jgi:hypothetical protein
MLSKMRSKFENTPMLVYNEVYAETYISYELKVIMHLLKNAGRLCPELYLDLQDEKYCDIFIGFPTELRNDV